jgi:hypothetical protein
VYGYDVKPGDDEYVDLIELVNADLNKAASPGNFMVDFIPACQRHLLERANLYSPRRSVARPELVPGHGVDADARPDAGVVERGPHEADQLREGAAGLCTIHVFGIHADAYTHRLRAPQSHRLSGPSSSGPTETKRRKSGC